MPRLRLRHILHPVRSARTAYRLCAGFFNEKAVCAVRRRLVRHTFRSIRRSRRDRCWCGGPLQPFKWHKGYGVCACCGCYVSRRPPLPEELKRLYSFELYWHTRQLAKGHPTLESRAVKDRADGRVDYWLGLVQRYGPVPGRVVEVGCAHAVLLAELQSRGYQCVGVEPDEQTCQWAREHMGVDVRAGLFPDCELPKCDLFLAFDVIEHSHCPRTFLQHAALLLNPGGVAIIQTPLDRHDAEPPFNGMFDKVFDDLEHLFVFTRESLQELSDVCGLAIVAEESWRLAHEVVVLKKK